MTGDHKYSKQKDSNNFFFTLASESRVVKFASAKL